MTCFAEAGGQHVSGMARAVELLGIRACLTQSTMDSGEGLPDKWGIHNTDYCIQVKSCNFFLSVVFEISAHSDDFFFIMVIFLSKEKYTYITGEL